MASNDLVEMQGEITDTYRGGKFKVMTDQGTEIMCHPTGKLRMNKIKLVVGDRVRIEVSPADLSVGRITIRL